jgi:hypothetical protein
MMAHPDLFDATANIRASRVTWRMIDGHEFTDAFTPFGHARLLGHVSLSAALLHLAKIRSSAQ